jgi:hypothetical protein
VPVLQEHAPEQLFDLDRLLDESGVLEIALLRQDGSRLELLFPSYLAYRKLDEGDAFEALKHAADSTKLGRSFYRVEESDFLDWYIVQRGGIRANDPLIHFVVMTLNDIIDVICRDAPEVVI